MKMRRAFTLLEVLFSAGFPGPNGSVTMNGQTLKAEAAAEMEKLETQLLQQVASSDGYSFIIG